MIFLLLLKGAGSWLKRLELINKSEQVKKSGQDSFCKLMRIMEKISRINWLDTQG